MKIGPSLKPNPVKLVQVCDTLGRIPHSTPLLCIVRAKWNEDRRLVGRRVGGGEVVVAVVNDVQFGK